jgi:drug/metabolite transporter (DMT)-like permease
MPAYVVYIVLIAALMNASWNALVKGGGDKLLTMVMITTAAAGVAAVALPFLPQPAPASWPYIAASVLLQTAYYLLLVGAYRHGDMSHVYPIMRGAAPLIVAALSAALIGEAVTGARWLGIGLICGGVLGMALHRPGHSVSHGTATAFALGNACVIASYTLVDGLGVRHSGAPAAYALWIFLLNGTEQLVLIMIWRRREFAAYLNGRRLQALAGGAATVASYGIALWAMTLAPVALVAALRETSILFATVISALMLKERVTLQRLACIVLIIGGAVTLRLA